MATTRNVNAAAATSGRASVAPGQAVAGGGGGAVGGGGGAQSKARQLSQLHSELQRLAGNVADAETLLRMTAVQAEAMRGLGSWHAGMFMAASKVLGEESVKEQAPQT